MRKNLTRFAFVAIIAVLVLSACGGGGGGALAPLGDEFTFGLILVGPRNDHGWSQAHYEAGLYIQ